ncbi:glutamate racemase [Wenyingzhuangia sp. 2_MG-2023]|uniref:glutamate racemase n=1 Tax=Wenyingzhuangia sp. 2_MG-2023 TaxID=3062639 RepID=UPI0026E29D75|nr:glutamate racemase [Wenyingzhuangia sp. 2_MG-2023]MDO6736437.1 glutamate racemase [Wenyingzhuangia sp. 2_MG-2023]MDO6801251.1 glutamate racemase [Wenyingzhuangia sp. 1_MG-2023]
MLQKPESPIGVFDSGVGGTSIWKEIIHRLPNENTVYLADSKNAPYGEKSEQEIIAICIKNTEILLQKGVKIIVVACNTATTNAINILRDQFDIPFIGIEPAIKPAALATKTKAIGILATKGTLSSHLFHETAQKFASNISVIEQEGTGLVPLIENNLINSFETKQLLQNLLTPMVAQNIDYLVLGCSHYPYLIPEIREIIGDKVTIIDSGCAVAKQTEKILFEKNLRNNTIQKGKHYLMSNSDPKTLTHLVKDIENTVIDYVIF